MIPIISGNDPQGPDTLEQVTKHNVNLRSHIPVLQPAPPIKTEDNVMLSHRSKALHLREYGCSVHEIALIMNLDTKTVDELTVCE